MHSSQIQAILSGASHHNIPAVLAQYQQALLAAPHDYLLHYGIGLCLYLMGGYAAAITSFDQAIKEDKLHVESYTFRARCHILERDFVWAIHDLDHALRFAPYHPELYQERGSAYVHLQRYDRAINDFTQAINFNSQYDEYYIQRGKILYIQRRYKEAVTDFQRRYNSTPKKHTPTIGVHNLISHNESLSGR